MWKVGQRAEAELGGSAWPAGQHPVSSSSSSNPMVSTANRQAQPSSSAAATPAAAVQTQAADAGGPTHPQSRAMVPQGGGGIGAAPNHALAVPRARQAASEPAEGAAADGHVSHLLGTTSDSNAGEEGQGQGQGQGDAATGKVGTAAATGSHG